MKPFLLLLFLIALLIPTGAAAQPAAPELRVEPAAGGVRLGYTAPAGPALSGEAAPAAQILALTLPEGGDATPQISALERVSWAGSVPTGELPARELPDGSIYPALPGFAPAPVDAPLRLLHEARLRGQRIGVYALSPVYQEAGTAYLATRVEAFVAGAQLLDDPARLAELDPAAPFLAAAPGPDPRAARPGWTIGVAQAGMQSLGLAALKAAGLDPARVDVTKLHLRRGSVAVALEEIRAGGQLVELRFYAPPPGDRYNAADTYWLSLEATPGLRMAGRDARPQGGPSTSTALVRGVWYAPRAYEPRLPGPDNDHFFSADLRVAPPPAGQPGSPATTAAMIVPTLPVAGGAVVITIVGASFAESDHRLQASMGATVREAVWSGQGDWSHTMTFPLFAAQLPIALLPQAQTDAVSIDRVLWELPAQLSFGGKGALFYGLAGRRVYQLSGLPAGAALYSLDDPARPQRLTIGAAAFEDVEDSPRPYLLAGSGTLFSPPITRYAPVDLGKALDATAVYIAPRSLLAGLEPLLAWRRAQGQRVTAVAAEAIYNGWSAGQTDPAAIRAFLRYAAASWKIKPTAAVLVGDGTNDPRNYQGIGQASLLPPYLLRVDPWLGETACEPCFAQLDGDSPLDDLMPDLALGRLPVKSATELAALIQKIIGYERDAEVGRWQTRVSFIADNADSAGDFAAVADRLVARQPASVTASRVYYDPRPPANQPWRERDPLRALERTIAAFDAGAMALVFLGHGLQYQWAVTGPPLQSGPDVPQDRRYLLNVDFARAPANRLRLPAVLSMTCLSGAFQTPSVRGTTIDEALLLHSGGGAIATWSSSGLGVLYGHEALANGFFAALWRAPGRATIGQLTQAGYANLLATGTDVQALRTFVLLGDPLTPLRALANLRELHLPLVQR